MQDKIERVGIHIVVFLVARCQLLFMCPFIVPFVMALEIRGIRNISIYFVALLGVYSRAGLLHTLRYGIVLLILRVIGRQLYRKNTGMNGMEMAISGGFFLGAISVAYECFVAGDLKYIIYALMEGLLVAAFLLVYEQGISMFFKKNDVRLGAKEYIGGFVIGLTALFGCTQIRMPLDIFITVVAGSVLFSLVKCQLLFGGNQRGNQELAITDEMLVQKVVGNRVYDFGQVFMSMEKMLRLHEQSGERMRKDSLSNVYLSGDGVSLLNAVESQNNRLMEMRRNFIRQIGQVGEAISSFRSEIVDSSIWMERLETEIIERFERSGIHVVKAVAYMDRQQHLHVFASCQAKGRRAVVAKKLAEILSKISGRRMACTGNEEEIISTERKLISFIEEGKYMLTTGVVRKGRSGEHFCGDNFSVTKLESQKALLVISDGMGSGEQAYVESEQIVDLTEQLLEAGFCRELAIDILNSFISFMADGTMSSTLDLTMIDFYTGYADFVKMGASTTFIKRKRSVECIRSTSLPVGVLDQVEFDTCKRLLYHGDVIVMVSDGVLDGVIFENKEEYLASLIAEMDTCNAQVMAKQIMDEIIRMQRKTLRDDSTVLVAIVWEK